jgi:cell division control protein 6
VDYTPDYDSDNNGQNPVQMEWLKNSKTPDRMPNREDNKKELMQMVFEMAGRGDEPQNYWLLGKPGTGKTAMVKSLAKFVKDDFPQDWTDRFDIVYVNCSRNSTYHSLMEAIFQNMGMKWNKRGDEDKQLRDFFEEMRDSDKHYIFVIDELDRMVDKAGRNYLNDLLYIFTRPETTLTKAGLDELTNEEDYPFSYILISNDSSLQEKIRDDMESSSASDRKMTLTPYDREEIKEILLHRQEKAFKDYELDEEALEIVGKTVEKDYDSDIRKGLAILRNIPEIVQGSVEPQSKAKQVAVVRKAIQQVKREQIESYVVEWENSNQVLILMDSIYQEFTKSENNGNRTLQSKVLDAYMEGCQQANLEPNSETWIRRRLQGLVDRKLLERGKVKTGSGNPTYYKPNFGLETFREIVQGRMNTSLLERLHRDLDIETGIDVDASDTDSENELETEEDVEERMEALRNDG